MTGMDDPTKDALAAFAGLAAVEVIEVPVGTEFPSGIPHRPHVMADDNFCVADGGRTIYVTPLNFQRVKDASAEKD